jgi:hypothetical protein
MLSLKAVMVRRLEAYEGEEEEKREVYFNSQTIIVTMSILDAENIRQSNIFSI